MTHLKDSFVFFGTPHVAAETLRILVDAGYTPSLVVTNPDKPQGRGMHMRASPTKEVAIKYNIPVITPEKITDESIQNILEDTPTYAIVVAYGHILPQKLIEAFPKGILNVHYSLLPKYRGATPLESALLSGDTETGVTIQRMIYELDAGDIIAQKTIPVSLTASTKELRPLLTQMGAELLSSTLDSYLENKITPIKQDDEHATFCKKIKKEDGEISLNDDAQVNWNKFRAYNEWPGTFFYITKKDGTRMRVKVNEARYENGVFTPLSVTPEGKKCIPFSIFERQQHA